MKKILKFIKESHRAVNKNQKKMKLNLIVILILSFLATAIHCSVVNEFVQHAQQRRTRTTQKFTIEDLLTKTFPYNDPRHDSQYDMDPCKAGKVKQNF